MGRPNLPADAPVGAFVGIDTKNPDTFSFSWGTAVLGSGKPAPVIAGLTGDQRFSLGWAQIHRSIQRDEDLRNQIMSDPHSPAKYGTNGVVRNMDAWHAPFDIKPGDALYLAPNKRVHVW